jgi:rubredoxin
MEPSGAGRSGLFHRGGFWVTTSYNLIRRSANMSRYVCTVCGYIYDEAEGIPGDGIAAGTRFAALPSDWACPVCGASKSEFEEQ